MSSAPTPGTGSRGERFVIPLLAVAVIASVTVLLAYRSHLGFMFDDWEFVIYRHTGSINDFLDPHNEHISILPVALYKVMLAIFGMGSAMPLHIVSTGVFAASVVLLFVYMRRRIDPWLALIGCVIVLFLGSAWEDLLWAFQVGFFLSIASGIGALLALDRNDRKGDRIACGLIFLSILSSSMGLSFMAGAFVEWLMNGRDRVRRLYVFVAPLVFYLLWYAGWGHKASNGFSLHNVLHSPLYTVKAVAEGVSDLTGAMHFTGSGGNLLAVVLLVILAAGLAAHLWRTRRISTGLLMTLVIGLSFWVLAGFNQIPGRDFDASRYQYPSVIFLLMILANGFEGAALRTRYLVAMGAIAAVAVFSNLIALNHGYTDVFRPQTERDIASLSALEMAGPQASDALVGMNQNDTAYIDSAGYQDARSRYGPAVDPREDLSDLPLEDRHRTDLLYAKFLPFKSKVVKKLPAGASCRVLTETATGSTMTPLGSRGLIVKANRGSAVVATRFGAPLTVPIAIAAPGLATAVRVRPDDYPGMWKIGLSGGAGKFSVCRVPAT